MEVTLNKKPGKSPILLEGFPGFGLVGTIASEYLIDNLDTELIGKISFDDLPPMIAIHEGKVVEPLGIFYNKKYNIIILHAITSSQNLEWKIAKVLCKLATQLKVKEIICLEGVGSPDPNDVGHETFYYSSDKKRGTEWRKHGLQPLNEGIIMGVTGAMLVTMDKIPISALFAETASNMPDSTAAANIIVALDKYLKLKVDPKPLLNQAQEMENKLKDLMSKSQQQSDIAMQKKLNYVG